MPELKTHGYGGWWPMKQFLGRTRDGGVNVYTESFVNMETGEVHHDPERGWNGEPPYPTGDLSHVRSPGDAYRANYEAIKWDNSSDVDNMAN